MEYAKINLVLLQCTFQLLGFLNECLLQRFVFFHHFGKTLVGNLSKHVDFVKAFNHLVDLSNPAFVSFDFSFHIRISFHQLVSKANDLRRELFALRLYNGVIDRISKACKNTADNAHNNADDHSHIFI